MEEEQIMDHCIIKGYSLLETKNMSNNGLQLLSYMYAQYIVCIFLFSPSSSSC